MSRSPIRRFFPTILLFVIVTFVFVFLDARFTALGLDTTVVLIGNAVLFLATSISFMMGIKAVRENSHHAFFRLIYGSFLVKLVLLAAAAFTYIRIAGKDVNKPSLFVCMALYIIYTFMEVRTLVRSTRRKQHG